MDGGHIALPEQLSCPARFAADVIYQPETPFLKMGQKSKRLSGQWTGYAAHQGAVAFELWTGAPCPVRKFSSVWKHYTNKEARETECESPASSSYDAHRKGVLISGWSWLSQLWQPQKVVIVTDNRVSLDSIKGRLSFALGWLRLCL